MRPSEIIKRQAGLTNKYADYSVAACMVQMRHPAGIPDRVFPGGRPLHRNVNDPYQFEITTNGIASRSASEAWISFDANQSTRSSNKSFISETPRLNVRRIDQAKSGYSGFVPGLNSEGLNRESYSRCVAVANQLRHP